jgi:hypothetical protein
MNSMQMSLVPPMRTRAALLVMALSVLSMPVMAQGRSASRVESVIVTAPSVRVRTAPSISSLSIDEYARGSVFATAPAEYQYKDWLGVMLDGRVVFIPRDAIATRSAATPAPVMESAMVRQAGTPLPAAPVVAAPVTPVPTMSAARPEPRVSAPVPAPARTEAAPPAAPPATTPVMVAVTPEPRPALPAPERAAAPTPQRPAEIGSGAPVASGVTAAEQKTDQPAFNARRAGIDVTVGLLASVTPIQTAGIPTAAHVSGNTYLGASYHGLGAYIAPEYGQGGGYRSTMLVGGLSLNLINLHMLRVTALGGYGNYSETTMPTDSTTAPVTRKLNIASAGGMVSIPFIGPVRLAYRGQYNMGTYLGVSTKMTRHSVGLVF